MRRAGAEELRRQTCKNPIWELAWDEKHKALQPDPKPDFLNRGPERDLIGCSRERQCGEPMDDVTRKESANVSCRE